MLLETAAYVIKIDVTCFCIYFSKKAASGDQACFDMDLVKDYFIFVPCLRAIVQVPTPTISDQQLNASK